MSLTSLIKQKGLTYQKIISLLDLDVCYEIINHHNKLLADIIHKPVENTNFPLTGMAIIYALRDYIGGENVWNQTVAGKLFLYPRRLQAPIKYIVMALMDKGCRSRKDFEHIENYIGTKNLVEDYKPTIEDVNNIYQSFPNLFSKTFLSSDQAMYINPTFSGSNDVGGADANMIIGNTLWDVRTTAKRNPLSIDDIAQQIGYYLLDYNDEYELENISWYYTRQECIFTHPISLFLNNKNYLKNNDKQKLIQNTQ